MSNIGRVLYGSHYDGSEIWGRHNFNDKRIEAEGVDWIVARDVETGRPYFGEFDTEDDKQCCIAEWSIKVTGET